jgi:hypothetical protein
MSSLAEIESAVDRLSFEEQEALLRHLAMKVRRQNCGTKPAAEEWMDRLDTLRASIDSGRRTLTTDQILAESREERN